MSVPMAMTAEKGPFDPAPCCLLLGPIVEDGAAVAVVVEDGAVVDEPDEDRGSSREDMPRRSVPSAADDGA